VYETDRIADELEGVVTARAPAPAPGPVRDTLKRAPMRAPAKDSATVKRR
jgi:hypothetical protein